MPRRADRRAAAPWSARWGSGTPTTDRGVDEELALGPQSRLLQAHLEPDQRVLPRTAVVAPLAIVSRGGRSTGPRPSRPGGSATTGGPRVSGWRPRWHAGARCGRVRRGP